jgi:hypothetical protein
LVVFIALTGCKTYKYFNEQTNCHSKCIRRPPRSTTYKELEWTKCYYADRKLQSKSFVFHRTGCWSEIIYYSKYKDYYSNGHLKQKTVDKRAIEKTQEFYSNGKLKCKIMSYVKSNLIDTADVRQIIFSKIQLVDSLTGKIQWTEKLDTVSIVKVKF